MKQIEPINIWQNGQVQVAEVLNAYAISDNLNNSATFFYVLQSIEGTQLSQGNLVMTGEAYEGYVSNEYAYNWIAEQLSLVIINNIGMEEQNFKEAFII